MQHTSILTLTVAAAGAVTQRRLVGFGGAQITAAGALAMGVARTDAVDGDNLAVDAKGTAIVEAGGAVSTGDEIVSDASGRAITNPEIGGEFVVGHALEGAGGAGEPFEILLR